jgi:hypothetical protein
MIVMELASSQVSEKPVTIDGFRTVPQKEGQNYMKGTYALTQSFLPLTVSTPQFSPK